MAKDKALLSPTLSSATEPVWPPAEKRGDCF